MTTMTPSNDASQRIVKALGLERCRSLKLCMAVDAVVTVEAEQYVEPATLDAVATVLETRKYALVPVDELGSLTEEEKAALKHAIVWLPPAYAPQHDALRRLLARMTK